MSKTDVRLAHYIFEDEHFMTAAEKQLVLKQWQRFLKALQCMATDTQSYHAMPHGDHGHYPLALEKPFTERLYHHLIQHCDFIAHYNRHGFLSTYFANPDSTLLFLSQFDGNGRPQSIEYGGIDWHRRGQYVDINTAMVEVATPMIPQMLPALLAQKRNQDLAEAMRLATRHGMRVVAEERATNE